MLDIAESVFYIIADRLKQLNKTVKQVFGKLCTVIDEFEGEKDVEVISA